MKELMPDLSQNRRKFPRRKFPRGVGILVQGSYFVSEGMEIGEGGISFMSPNQYPEGQQIVISFQIPGGSFVSVISEIRNFHLSKTNETNKEQAKERSKIGVHGCAFVDLRFEQKREVRLFVSAR
jgi:hypothetical protein